MTPFQVTVEITEARQCHQAVSQLLRIFPSLRLTITANETIPASSGPSQTDSLDAHIRAYVAACIASIYPRADPRRFRDAIEAACSGRLDSNPYAERTRIEAGRATDAQADAAALTAARCATPANADGSYPWKPGEHTEAAADARLEADAAAAERAFRAEGDGGNNNSDEADVDDSAYQ